MYNMSNLIDANEPITMLLESNSLANGYMFAMLLFILFLTYIVVFKGQSMKKVMLGGSFFITLVSVLMFVLGFIDMVVLIVPILVLFGSLIAYYFIQ